MHHWLCLAFFGVTAVLSRWLIFRFDFTGHQDTLCDCVLASDSESGNTDNKYILACSAGPRPIKDIQICTKCRGFLYAAYVEILLVVARFSVGLSLLIIGVVPSKCQDTRSCPTCEPVCHREHAGSGVFDAGVILLVVTLLSYTWLFLSLLLFGCLQTRVWEWGLKSNMCWLTLD